MDLFIFSAAREMLALGSIEQHYSFDQAEAAEKRQDFKAAEQLYREAIERMEHRHEPYLRLAEVLIKLKHPIEAAEEMQKALDRVEDIDARARFSFRLADILEAGGEGNQSMQALNQIREEAKGKKYENYAVERIERATGTKKNP